MNELKPEDVMMALEEFASLTNCNNMRYLEGCGHFCKVLREPIDNMAGGRSSKCNEHCEHYSPPRDEELFRAALALLREKDAILEMCAEIIERQDKELAQKDAEIERLNAKADKWLEHLKAVLSERADHTEAVSEAITEFAERVKRNCVCS